MSVPQVDEYGSLDLRSVEELPTNDLRAWIRERLHGRDLASSGDGRGDDMPHYLLALLYPKLDRPVREDVQGIVLEFLRELASGSEDWLGRPGAELLMLVEPVLGESRGREDAVDLLRTIADPRRFDTNAEPDLHFRTLQSLIALKHRAPHEFWQQQFREAGDRYSPVVVEGLALVSAASLFNWLTSVPWTDALEDAVVGFLPSLLKDLGTPAIEHLLAEQYRKLSRRAQRTLKRFCAEEGLTVPQPTAINQQPHSNAIWGAGWKREAETIQQKEVLKGTRWLLLKNPENLDDQKNERQRLEEPLELNKPLPTANYMKEDLRALWDQPDKATATKRLDDWVKRAEVPGIRMLQRFAKMLAANRSGILAYYDFPLSTGPLKGTNNKIKTIKRQAYGVPDHEFLKLKIYAIHETKYALIDETSPNTT